MLTWGKLVGLAAEIHSQVKADPGAKQPLLELIRTHAQNETPEAKSAPAAMAPAQPPIQRRVARIAQEERPATPGYDLLSLRIDPSQVRKTAPNPEQIAPPAATIEPDVAAIDSS